MAGIVGAQQPTVFPQIINPTGTIACGPNRLMFSFLDAQNVPVAKPEQSVEVALFDLGADPAKPVQTGLATFIWAIEPTVGVYVVRCRRSRPPARGAREFTPDRRRLRAGDHPRRLRRPADVARSSRSATRRPRRTRRPSPTSGATSRRSRPTTSRSTPSTRRPSPTRSPPRSRSSWSSRRRSSARPPNAGRRSTGSSRSPRPTRT